LAQVFGQETVMLHLEWDEVLRQVEYGRTVTMPTLLMQRLVAINNRVLVEKHIR